MSFTKICIVIFLVFVFCSNSFADKIKLNCLKKGGKTVDFSIGYGQNHRIPDDKTIQLYQFDMCRLRYAETKTKRIEFGCEIAYYNEIEPSDNYSLSAIGALRYYFYQKNNIAIGADAGIGLWNFNNKVPELGTKFNFNEQFGVTLQIAATEDTALTFAYRFIHVSNARLSCPNLGVNESTITIGYTWFN